jgi:hypothetical protein
MSVDTLERFCFEALHRGETREEIFAHLTAALGRARSRFAACDCGAEEHTFRFAPNKAAGRHETRLLPEILASADRFWNYVEKTDTCWIWRGTRLTQAGGYGVIQIARKLLRAHRVAWILTTRQPIPDGLWLLHGCDNPPCVRPDPSAHKHLFLGDQLQNMRDMVDRGRSVRGRAKDPAFILHGERAPNAKLSDEKARQLIEEGRAGAHPAVLAGRYGVTIGHVYKMLRGERWIPGVTV